MKLIIAAILLFFSTNTLAKHDCVTSDISTEVKEMLTLNTTVPSHLKGATIIVRRADGVESAVSAELFKVVPRKQQRLITKVQESSLTTCKETLDNKNRVSLLGGSGTRSGLDKRVTEDQATFKTKSGLVGGLQYQRSLNERISVGVQGQTNKTGSLMIGLDF